MLHLPRDNTPELAGNSGQVPPHAIEQVVQRMRRVLRAHWLDTIWGLWGRSISTLSVFVCGYRPGIESTNIRRPFGISQTLTI
jgi:hypothetical protein